MYPAAPQDPDSRPGTVTIATAVTAAASGLAALCLGFMLIALLVSRDDVDETVRDDPDLQDLDFDVVAAVEIFQWVVAGMLLWCVVAIVLALAAHQRSRVARLLLAVSAGLAAVVSGLLGLLAVFPFLWTAASITAVVLVFSGIAGEWYAVRPNARLPAQAVITEL
jgi:hypothetical protein